MPNNGLIAVGPECERGAGGVRVGFQLFLAILLLDGFVFDNEVKGAGPVPVFDDDVRTLGAVAAKGDGEFDFQTFDGVTVVIDETVNPELAYDFFGLNEDVLAADLTSDVGFAILLDETRFYSLDGGLSENVERMAAVANEFVQGGHYKTPALERASSKLKIAYGRGPTRKAGRLLVC